MKKVLYVLVSFLIVSALFTSCEKEEEEFDETLLYGEWQSGTEHWLYKSSGNGVFWDTSDGKTEATGREYTWTLIKSELGLVLMSTSGEWGVPKYYTVTELTATSLKYKNDFGTSYSFVKVK